MLYDLVIIGGGPAGISAGVYSARKRLKTLFITSEFGGQSSTSTCIENWIGEIFLTGEELAKKLREHLEHYRGEFLEIKDRARAKSVTKTDSGFTVTIEDGQVFEGKTVIIATGSSRRKLSVPGASEYESKGIVYCATCDAPLFSGSPVAVIGGGNAGFETASQLLAYASEITIIEQSPTFRAEKITVDKLLANPKIKGITNAQITAIKGEKFVTSLSYKNLTDGTEHDLPVSGVFVEIGNTPATDFIKGTVETAPNGAIKIDARSGQTNIEGIWAAGDCADNLYHQNNIAAGQGALAVEDVYTYLMKH